MATPESPQEGLLKAALHQREAGETELDFRTAIQLGLDAFQQAENNDGKTPILTDMAEISGFIASTYLRLYRFLGSRESDSFLLESAQKYADKGMQLADEAVNESSSNDVLTVTVLRDLGKVLAETGDYESAAKALNRAVKIAETHNIRAFELQDYITHAASYEYLATAQDSDDQRRARQRLLDGISRERSIDQSPNSAEYGQQNSYERYVWFSGALLRAAAIFPEMEARALFNEAEKVLTQGESEQLDLHLRRADAARVKKIRNF